MILLSESKLRDLSVEFSVNTIKLCENIKGHSSLVNQLECSATSIGANIHEANYAHGKPDFIAKMQIALKECYETEYWLEVFVKSGILDREAAKDIYNQCGAIRRMLIASINTAKENARGRPGVPPVGSFSMHHKNRTSRQRTPYPAGGFIGLNRGTVP